MNTHSVYNRLKLTGAEIAWIASAATTAAATYSIVEAVTAEDPVVAEAEAPPERSDADVQQAAQDERRRRAAARSRKSTILSGPASNLPGEIGGKTLLGQ